MLDPASEVHDESHPVFNMNEIRGNVRAIRLKIVEEANNVRQVNLNRDLKSRLFQESR